MDSAIDTIHHISVDTSLQLQLAAIYSMPVRFSALEVQILQVQQQKGPDDCGMFSIAFAIEVCEGNDPQLLRKFSQRQMRSHLYKCLQLMKLKPFPKESSKCLHCEVNLFHMKVFCLCRMPEEFDTDMVECSKCEIWYHYRCVGLVENETVPDDWVCVKCQ